jgi:hypothetical protein
MLESTLMIPNSFSVYRGTFTRRNFIIFLCEADKSNLLKLISLPIIETDTIIFAFQCCISFSMFHIRWISLWISEHNASPPALINSVSLINTWPFYSFSAFQLEFSLNRTRFSYYWLCSTYTFNSQLSTFSTCSKYCGNLQLNYRSICYQRNSKFVPS